MFKIGKQVKVGCQVKAQTEANGIIIARIEHAYNVGTEQEHYHIRWEVCEGLHGNTVIEPKDILEVL